MFDLLCPLNYLSSISINLGVDQADTSMSFPGIFNDLIVWDSIDMTWTNLSTAISGITPKPRQDLGMVSHQGYLYIFGGWAVPSGVQPCGK